MISETWVQSYARTSVLEVFRRIQYGRLTVISKYRGEKEEPDVFGENSAQGPDMGRDVVVEFHSPKTWVRMCLAFDLGFAEAYMLQEVECENLVGLFSLYVANRDTLGFYGGSFLQQLLPRISRLLINPNNDVKHARLNASFHYDTSNDLFSGFLSQDMNYSSAIWSEDSNEPLEPAQRRKVHSIIDKARISASDHVLDIGCGWGGLAIEAVRKTGCRVTGLTLSGEQKELAEKRIKEAGLEDQITILLCDYRHPPKPDGGYDRIVSVEMLEHVGDKFMNQYFESISSLLKKEGGVLAIQGITMINPIHSKLSHVGGFLDKYIFPGGYLPTINQLLTSIHAGSQGTLEVETVQSIGPHYIKTLQCWREKFLRNWETIKQSFVAKHQHATEDDIEAFRRRWIYYFTYCEAGFRTRILGDYVVTAVRTPERELTGAVVY
ncbi:cyclopropane-fatty-acyl-phospholipid synthase [Hyaloscypha variabilis]